MFFLACYVVPRAAFTLLYLTLDRERRGGDEEGKAGRGGSDCDVYTALSGGVDCLGVVEPSCGVGVANS